MRDVILCDERHQMGYDWAADKGIDDIKKMLSEVYQVVYYEGGQSTFKVKYPVHTNPSSQIRSSDKKQSIGFYESIVEFNNRVTDKNHFQETRNGSIYDHICNLFQKY